MDIPVFIVSGFLGSGKTTLLLRLLEESARRGIGAALLMNELGKVDVDGSMVAEQLRLPVEKLLDGCICCTKKSEVEASLLRLAAGKPDVLFLELTGVADPAELRGLLRPGSTAAAAGLQLAAVLNVVDAGTFSAYNSRFSSDRELVRTLRGQVTAADLILMNKADTTDSATILKVRRAIRKQNNSAALLETIRCNIDVRSLLHGVHPRTSTSSTSAAEQPLTKENPSSTISALATQKLDLAAIPELATTNIDNPSPFRMASESGNGFSGGALRSVTLTASVETDLTKEQVEHFLLQQGSSLIRAKGYVRSRAQTLLVQHAAGRTEWQPSTYPGQPYIVLIGTGLSEQQLQESWAALAGSLR
ncbi:GTP-binding protein [Paenibacillus herberti]|uniref:Cobalamin biosynthesis protein CobW n=1 Tax=Paenibacillus herberti TaxID=1619309 RepID=A0A229P369_9BACL|nr:GTP-binding protein [Paenibacillus herberti]OXM16537.1 cobalamin biosynthesis protein CobW [Paenibacillus herberti]